jgi:hypothetical protein
MFLLDNRQARRFFVAGLFLWGSVLCFPVSVQAQSISNDKAYQAVLLQLIAALQTQIQLLQAQLVDKKIDTVQTQSAMVVRPKTVFNGAPVMNRYDIATESDLKKIANFDHRQYLKRVYEIFPDTYDEKLSEFMVFKDKGGDFGAFVETIPPDHTSWSFAVNTDLLGRENTESSTELIVHELAHIISYESIVGVPLPGSASCHSYFKTRGCPKENSYLAVFVDEFWSVSNLERALRLRKNPDAIDIADEYFESNEDEYVSGYAALSPEEDFAESFAQYVVARRSQTNSTASEKVWWFDQFTDLQDIRQYIR